MEVKARRQGNSNIFTIPKNINVPYDIWSDQSLENTDFDALRKQELSDLGYNPREVTPIGKEKTDA